MVLAKFKRDYPPYTAGETAEVSEEFASKYSDCVECVSEEKSQERKSDKSMQNRKKENKSL